MSGFLGGLSAGFERVKSFVGGIGSWIADHKGPKQYDLRLLQPAGKWILQGLQKGLNRNIYRVQRAIGNVNDVLKVSPNIRSNDFPYDGPGSIGGFGKTIQQHITVNTQEIDPVKHAADLGWELAVRV
jgi:hypothetical protein